MFYRSKIIYKKIYEKKGRQKWLFTYNIFPPWKWCRNVVDELVPIPSVRSTSSVVNSPYTMKIKGNVIDLIMAKKMPITIKMTSHLFANRNCNPKTLACKSFWIGKCNFSYQNKLERFNWLCFFNSLRTIFHFNINYCIFLTLSFHFRLTNFIHVQIHATAKEILISFNKY